jgi:hypothetical protein
VSTISFRSEAFARGARLLRTALGPAISTYLEDPSIVEVMLNPDGRLWIDRLSGGLEDTGCRVTPADAERIVRLVAHHVGVEVHACSPRVSAELPGTGERFEGLVSPVVAAPCFAIRRPAIAVFSLGDYVEAGIMSDSQAEFLLPAHSYPDSEFPDAASRLVDAERRGQFEEEGAHFESRYFLTLLWLPPADDAARAEAWLYENRAQGGADWRAALDGFVDRTDRVLALIEGFMPEAEWLDDGETLTYLHACISTRRQRVRVPEMPMYLDAILVDEYLTGCACTRKAASAMKCPATTISKNIFTNISTVAG